MAPNTGLNPVPSVWLLMGHKAGDNSQVLALAEGLRWPFEIKRFVYQPYELVTNLLLGTTLSGVIKGKSSPLGAPWPDLVLSAGRRNEPVARWIKATAGDHPVRIVHVGRPWTMLDRFDLIVTTPQYRLPALANVIENRTPLHRVTESRLLADSESWAPRLAQLPRPYVAVVMGGSSGPYTFDHPAATRLAVQASALAKDLGGSLLVTTSARTPAPMVDTFARNLTRPAHIFRWSKDATENPYFAFLGLAQSIIVTGDSMSMLTEACATRKPVHIFDLGEGRHAMREDGNGATVDPGAAQGRRFEPGHFKAWSYRQMMRIGPQRLSRDIRIIHRELICSGRAVWLGDPFPANGPLPPIDSVDRAVERVRDLFQGTPQRIPSAARDKDWLDAVAPSY
jgi:mitochondrial fission protein ELM1